MVVGDVQEASQASHRPTSEAVGASRQPQHRSEMALSSIGITPFHQRLYGLIMRNGEDFVPCRIGTL